jgi:FdhE protein
MTATIVQPGTIEPPAGALPVLVLPQRNLFETRAARLSALAADHPLADYLNLLALLARAQHAALALVRAVPLPSAQQLARCREHRLPPLDHAWTRAPVWRATLHHIVSAVASAAVPLPHATRATLARLSALHDDAVERLADTLLAQDNSGIDRAAAPFVAAALQVYWLHMATSLGDDAFGPPALPYLCPVCGSEPVASVVRIGAAQDGLRYLTCSLCCAQWHAVRIKCVYCDSTKGISYYGIEGGTAAIKAERCDACATYLKILYMDKDPELDAVADDVASVALDVLMAESGSRRSGVNFFLM